ncbi:MAG: NAD-dependent epimerase/dehydratase family protein [Verrucomicrobiaceae bacterium]|nr:MAG: NAD-dependent epimerase/dehydratase family protein [Verrucomicrobiaceae bacterium]
MTPLSVLVTGSSGFIGTHVVRHLHEAGHKVTALDQLPPNNPLPDGVRFQACDIRQGMFPQKTFDAVVHLAALPGVRPSLDDPLGYQFTNVIGTIRLLDHCRKTGTPHFVFASSSSVYGPDTQLPAKETTTADPCSPYALTKLHGEQWGRLYSRLHGLRFLALRFFSVWGPGQRPDLALEAFRRKIGAGQPVVINGDGSQRRDLTHVEDIARAVELAIHWPGPGAAVLNVGTGKNHSVMDMLDAATKTAAALQFPGSNFTDFTPAVTYQKGHPADVPETLASLTAVAKELGWAPRIFFPDEPVSGAKKV